MRGSIYGKKLRQDKSARAPDVWRLILSPSLDPFLNMAVDEILFRQVARQGSPPIVRLYGWSGPSVTLGRFQDALKAVNLDGCRKHGVTLVRRLTGGRLVFHGDDMTYSVIARLGNPPFQGGIIHSYNEISRWIVEACRTMGFEASLAAGVPRHSRKSREKADLELDQTRELCFSSTSRYEVVCGGRKLAGSAQMRAEGAMLQQGSIPLDLNVNLMADVMRRPGGKSQFLSSDTMASEYRARATSVSEAAAREVVFSEMAEALAGAVACCVTDRLEKKNLTDDEVIAAEKLVQSKYSTVKWNFETKRS